MASVEALIHSLPHRALCTSRRLRTTADHPAVASSEFRVALLTPGPISDQAWNAGAYQGLLRIRDSLGAKISHIQTATPADFEENFRLYGKQRYDLVFGHGFEFQDERHASDRNFRTPCTSPRREIDSADVAPMVFGLEDASYLAGFIAGTISKSGTVGAIGGTELPPVKSSFLAFDAGAHAANPRTKVIHLVHWQLGRRERREGAGTRPDRTRR